jgi:hypothetical protein
MVHSTCGSFVDCETAATDVVIGVGFCALQSTGNRPKAVSLCLNKVHKHNQMNAMN